MTRTFLRPSSWLVASVALGFATGFVARRGFADAPPGRYAIRAGTVHDTRTKLTWQQDHAPNVVTHANARMYCAELHLGAFDWRLPSLKELQTLVDEHRTNPAIDPAAFPNTPGKFFWTSDVVTSFPDHAWTVDFNRGGLNFFSIETLQSVRCVHAG